MAGAGTVEIDFAAETAKFTAELKKVRADLSSLGVQVGAISKSLSSFGTALKSAFVSAGVVAGIRAIVKATEESEAAITQLDAALKSASSAVRLSSADFQAFAKTMQTTTTFTDEAVTGVETVLLAFRSLSGQTILSATSAVLDLSTRLGTDLTSSAKLVGRALEDPEKGLTALSRAGVVFSKSQQELIKQLASTGQKAKAQSIILAELEKRYGGAAEAARNTLGGALKGLGNAVGDLFEGDKNSFSSATKSINGLTLALNDPKIKEGFDNLIAAVSKTLGFVTKLAIGLTSLGAGIGGLFTNPDDFLTASQALEKELRFRQSIFQERVKSGQIAQKDLDDEQQFLETLKQRIVLAKQLEERQKQAQVPGLGGGHGPLRGGADAADFDNDAVLGRLKAQEDVLELRAKAITASITSAGAFLDSLDRQLGDGESTLTKLDEEARKQQAKSREDFAKDQLDISVSEFDRRLKLEQEFTDRVNDEQRRRVENESRAQQQMLEIREQAVFNAIGILTFLIAGHDKASKAVTAVHKAQALLQLYHSTSVAAGKAIEIYGPTPIGFAAAAAAIAFGAIQAAAVLSDRPPGHGGGRSAAFDVSPNSSSGATQSAIASQPLGAQQKPQTTINVFGWSEAAIRDLVRRIKDEVGDHDLTLIRQP